jgi:hypothetical protein
MLRDAANPAQTPATGVSLCQLDRLSADQIFPSTEVDYAFLSFSLGSRMLYDVLSGLANDSSAGDDPSPLALARFATRTRNFFMAANQMPLLGVGRVTINEPGTHPRGPTYSTDTLLPTCQGGFFSFAGCLRQSAGTPLLTFGLALPPGAILTEGLQVIAFHDPADLLGFRASGGIKNPGTTTFVEVSHRNTPVILGLLAWPGAAHAKELDHTDSRTLILCGGKASGNGTLRAKVCL